MPASDGITTHIIIVRVIITLAQNTGIVRHTDGPKSDKCHYINCTVSEGATFLVNRNNKTLKYMHYSTYDIITHYMD